MSTNNPCIQNGACASPINFPQFIDTSICLCGLLDSKSSLPGNGDLEQLWRCIGDATDNVYEGTSGKWFNTSLPSQDLSGINQPQNWDDNPPDLTQAYALVEKDGHLSYEKLGSAGIASLVGGDAKCNGKNSTFLSETYYSHHKNGPSNTTSTPSASPSLSSTNPSTSPSISTTSSTSSSTTSGSPKNSNNPSTSASSSTPSPSSAAEHISFKSALILSMAAMPLVCYFV